MERGSVAMDQHRNPDGTYDGVGVMSDLSGISRDEVKALWENAKTNNAKLSTCPYHEFEQSPQTAPMRSLTHQKYVCKNCGGEVDEHAYFWHEQGRKSAPKPVDAANQSAS